MSHYSASAEENSTSVSEKTARSFESVTSGPSYDDGSSLQSSAGSSKNCMLQRNVRFVNSAAFIERIANINGSDFEDGTKPNYLEELSPVPPLDLGSLEGSSDNSSSTCRKSFAKRVNLEPNEAYQNWLSAKRKLESEKVAQRKREEQQKLKMMKERKRLAEDKYLQWFERKSRSPSSGVVQSKSSTKDRSINLDEARNKVYEWKYKKECEEKRRREMQRLEEQHYREMARKRRFMAQAAWEHWSAGAASRPRPVPLNRGLFSLKGTVAPMFVNPNQWKDL